MIFHLLKKPFIFLLSIALFLIFISISFLLVTRENQVPRPLETNPLYTQSTLPISTRVADLISYMTLEEKIGQMTLVEKNSVRELDDILTYGLGAILSGFGGKPENNTASGWKTMIETFVDESYRSRLGIPLLYGVDAIHGHSNIPGATVFPHSIGLGASGDAKLVEDVARATADELLATGVRWSYSPTYDMPEDIRWGRVYETFSDDPTRASLLGSAYIQGLQSNPQISSSTIAVLATAKHYIGLGGMRWDTSSNKNFKIDQGMTEIDETRLRDHYLPPFKKAVDTGVGSVMVGLNSWGDTKIAGSSYLIQTVLKDELGFKGFVVSDWYGVYEIPGGNYKAAVTAINAGVDMIMLPFDYEEFTKNVHKAIVNGDIPESRINDAVSRILTAKFQLGLFDETVSLNTQEIGSSKHRTLAREAVAKSLVLLKNDTHILPITEDIRTIRVAGSSADNIGRQAGAWTVEWQGVDGNWLPDATSILEGIRESVSKETIVEFDLQGNFASGSTKAEIGIAIVGEAPYAEGWGDTSNPTLSNEDIATIGNLKRVCNKVIVVLITGRPLIITDEIKNWDSVVVAWLPGSEGAGISDVLFGKSNFSGKLPLPWPSSIAQLPFKKAVTNNDTPLFPRYFGLKY